MALVAPRAPTPGNKDKIDYSTGRVRENRAVAPDVFLLKVEGSFKCEKPAQFYMLRAWDLDPPLFRPMSVFDLSDEGISFLYAVRGRGTRLLSRLSSGDELTLLGPLGRGWERTEGRVALVGGGMGIAPLFFTAKVFGPPVEVFLGFRGKPLLVEEFGRLCDRLQVTSESEAPRYGQGGLVTDIFSGEGYSACYACGPVPMLATLSAICRRASVPLFLSLEERMACGIGACLGCTVFTKGGPKRVCRDGPVFPAEELLWDG